MKSDLLFERDMLFPTDNSIEPGCIHAQVYGPDTDAKIPVVLEAKTAHSPLKYIENIIRIMQSEIFDRIFIDVRKSVDIYIRTSNDQKAEFNGHSHIKVDLDGDKPKFSGIELK
ncbi:MAG TPA: hypothetical protein VHT96_01565 [Clostridia bacterium]|nr:hypothetical protein [Clostridia bacterium]